MKRKSLVIGYPAKHFSDEERRNTPSRVRRFHDEWMRSNDVKLRTFPNPGYDEIVAVAGIPFASLCSHHLLPFEGSAHVGYIPDKRICGLSKLARVVDAVTHRPQLQERATSEIADQLFARLRPLGVMVVLEATHSCMTIRGVRKPGSVAVTSAIRGVFRDPAKGAREEFLKLIEPHRWQ